MKSSLRNIHDTIREEIEDHIRLARNTLDAVPQIERICGVIATALRTNGTIYLCGNGGSAADCQHIAAELVGRFQVDGHPIRAVALTTDSSILTSLANDFGYQHVFKRQLEAFLRSGDILIVFSTSGNSQNIIEALKFAKQQNVATISLLGANGGLALGYSDYPIIIRSAKTAKIQEMHIMVGHILCQFLETEFRHAKP